MALRFLHIGAVGYPRPLLWQLRLFIHNLDDVACELWDESSGIFKVAETFPQETMPTGSHNERLKTAFPRPIKTAAIELTIRNSNSSPSMAIFWPVVVT